MKFEYFCEKIGVVQKDFPQGGTMLGLQMIKIWTFFGKEDQVEDMNPPQTKGEQVDNMDPPRKGGVMMILTSILMG